jgi:hypothetical protein
VDGTSDLLIWSIRVDGNDHWIRFVLLTRILYGLTPRLQVDNAGGIVSYEQAAAPESDETVNKRGLDLVDSGGFTNGWGKRGLDLVDNGGFTNGWSKRGLDLVDNGGFTNGWSKRGLDLVDNGGFTSGWGKRGLDLVRAPQCVFMQTNRHTGGRWRLPRFVAQTKSRHDQQRWLRWLVNNCCATVVQLLNGIPCDLHTKSTHLAHFAFWTCGTLIL